MFSRIKDFFSQVYIEMNKVVWPSYQELKGSTYLIIVFFILFAVFLFGIDWVIQKVIRLFV